MVLDEQHEMRAVFKGQLAADNRVDSALPCVRREAHRTIEAVSIGQRNRRQSKLGRALDQLFGMRSALQETKVRPGMELGVTCGSDHSYTPRMYQCVF